VVSGDSEQFVQLAFAGAEACRDAGFEGVEAAVHPAFKLGEAGVRFGAVSLELGAEDFLYVYVADAAVVDDRASQDSEDGDCYCDDMRVCHVLLSSPGQAEAVRRLLPVPKGLARLRAIPFSLCRFTRAARSRDLQPVVLH
jgi:hypothetical protein